MTDHLDGGWGDVSEDAPPGVDPATGEITGDPEHLVAAITATPRALDSLKKALGIEEEKADNRRTFASLDEFVEKWVVRTFRYHLESSHTTWCDQWWEHPLAQVILDAMWEAWEVSRRNAAGNASFLAHYGLPFMDRLTTPETSPFAGCKHTVLNPDGDVLQAPVHDPHHQQRLPVGIPEEGIFKVHPTKANPNP